jgi:N-acyl-D-aspartate/D-glutamate deacylase
MRVIAKEAMLAGAIGFSTSRNIFHQASDGSAIPSMAAEDTELREIAFGLADAHRGVMQAITVTESPCVEDFEMLHRIAHEAGRPLSFTLFQNEARQNLWREVMASVERANLAGQSVKAQVFNRPLGVILGLEASFHPFSMHPLYVEKLAKLSLAERVAEMRKPEVRAALIQHDGVLNHPFRSVVRRFEQMYLMSDPADYEPDPSTCVVKLAAARGISPDEVVYDMLLLNEGRSLLLVAAANYGDRNLDTTLELLKRDDTVLALGDGGAHYGMICDASYSTYTLTHWVRDRARGARLDLAEAVQMLCEQPAKLHGFRDRGRLERGMKADVNVIDFDRLTLFSPTVVRDLPGGGKRLTQAAGGYVATLVAGDVIQREGVDTGARPGRLVRDAGV